MKLIFCPECTDIVGLRVKVMRWCACERSWGQYLDDVKAEIGGDAIPVGFANSSFAMALKGRPREGQGSSFEAFVIPVKCPSVRRAR